MPEVHRATVEQMLFSEALRRNLPPRQFAFLFASAGLKDAKFDAAARKIDITSPRGPAEWLKLVPPVSIGVNIGVASVGIETRSVGEFLWSLLGASSAQEVESRIQRFRAQSSWADPGLAAVLRSSVQGLGDFTPRQRNALREAWEMVKLANPALPDVDMDLAELVKAVGYDEAKDFIKTYLAAGASDAELDELAASLVQDNLDVPGELVRVSSQQRGSDGSAMLQQALSKYLQEQGDNAAKAAAQREFDDAINDVQGVFAIASSMALIIGDRQLSHKIEISGKAAIDVVTGVQSLVAKGFSLAATGNIFMGGAALIGLFSGSGAPDPMLSELLRNQQIILDYLSVMSVELREARFQVSLIRRNTELILAELDQLKDDIRREIAELARLVERVRLEIGEGIRSLATAQFLSDYTKAVSLFSSPSLMAKIESGEVSDAVILSLVSGLNSQSDLATWVATSPAVVPAPKKLSADEILGLNEFPGINWAPLIAEWLTSDGLRLAEKKFYDHYHSAVLHRYEKDRLSQDLGDLNSYRALALAHPDTWFLGVTNFVELARVIPRSVYDPTALLEKICESGINLARISQFLVDAVPLLYAAWSRAAEQAHSAADRFLVEVIREKTNGVVSTIDGFASLAKDHQTAFRLNLITLKPGQTDWGKHVSQSNVEILNKYTVENDSNGIDIRVVWTEGAVYQFDDVVWSEAAAEILDTAHPPESHARIWRLRASELPLASRTITGLKYTDPDFFKRQIMNRAHTELKLSKDKFADKRFEVFWAEPDATIDTLMERFLARLRPSVENEFKSFMSEENPPQFAEVTDWLRQGIKQHYPDLSGAELEDKVQEARPLTGEFKFQTALKNLTIADFMLRFCIYHGVGQAYPSCERLRKISSDDLPTQKYDDDFLRPALTPTFSKSALESVDAVTALVMLRNGSSFPTSGYGWPSRDDDGWMSPQFPTAAGVPSLLRGVDRLRQYAELGPDHAVPRLDELVSCLPEIRYEN